jgi:hypothetical protein
MRSLSHRATFVMNASVSGWRWLVEITNHIGAAAIVLAVVGVSIFSGWSLPHWWWGLFILLGFYVVLFGEGAYRGARHLQAELQTAEEARSPSAFPDVSIKASAPLLVETEESKTFPGQRETLIAVRVTVTNREVQRRALLSFSAHVTVPEPRPMIRKLSRTHEDHPDPAFIPDPLKLDPQDQVAGEVFFLWSHDMDFLFGRDATEEKVIEFVMENLRVNATDHISTVSINLELPGTWYRLH